MEIFLRNLFIIIVVSTFFTILLLQISLINHVKTTPSNINATDSLNEFFEIHAKISAQQNVSLRKIFFCQPSNGGYGNRMYTFISSTLAAILLDCQLVLNWRNKATLYIDPPLNLFDKLNFSSDSNTSNQTYILPRPLYLYRPIKDMRYLIEEAYFIPTNYTRYYFNHGWPLFTEMSANMIYYDKFRLYKLARDETLDRAFIALKNYRNYSNEQLQSRVLNVAFEIGGNILNRIWKPNQDITNEVNYYMDKWFKNNYVIGIQMRAGDSRYIDEAKDHLKFINCALDIEQDYMLNSKRTDIAFKWFIATDSKRIRKFLFEHYREKSFTSNGTLGHTDSGGIGFRRAVLDVELLSKCDEVIVTSGSTFGWLAAMKMLKMPFYIKGRTSKMEKCLRAELGITPSNLFGYSVF